MGGQEGNDDPRDPPPRDQSRRIQGAHHPRYVEDAEGSAKNEKADQECEIVKIKSESTFPKRSGSDFCMLLSKLKETMLSSQDYSLTNWSDEDNFVS